jgi:hypothetical protein
MKNTEKKSMLTNDLRSKTWIGRIIENEDPLRQFRCRVRIFGLLDDIEDEMLPWFFPSGNNTFASTENGGFGDATYPKKDTLVKVSFPFGDIYSGEYFAIQHINPSLSAELEDDYENSQIIRYDEDEELKVLFTQQQGFLIHLRENIINIDKDDNITIKNNKDDYVEILNDGNINIYAAGEINNSSKLGIKNPTKNTAIPSGQGHYCAIPICPYTGLNHVGYETLPGS